MSLPSGYSELEYIQSSGTQYIDTGFKPNQDTRVLMDFEFMGSNPTNAIFGGRINNTDASFTLWAINGQIRTDYGAKQATISVSPSGRMTIDKNKNVTTVKGSSVTQTTSSFQSTATLTLFAVNRATDGVDSRMISGKLYSCKVYDDGALIRDYTPVRSSSGEIGLYDEVNSVFYGNSGTGSFTAGPVIYLTPDPPTNLDCEIVNGSAHLSWSPSASEDVLGYKIYQNGVLVGSTPYVYPLFEFPFRNDSLTESLLEFSELRKFEFDQKIDSDVQYSFSVTAYNSEEESDPVTISVYYETSIEITLISLVPNPVITEQPLTISAKVNEVIYPTIS